MSCQTAEGVMVRHGIGKKRVVLIALLSLILFLSGVLYYAKQRAQSGKDSHDGMQAAFNIPSLPENLQFLPGSQLTGVWANEGGDKVTRDELRAARGMNVKNSAWDGVEVKQFGARNEVVSINLVLEAAKSPAQQVSIVFDQLTGPNKATISSRKVDRNNVFTYVGRNIELFLVKYLQIRGLSRLGYEASYDERHVPARFRLPYTLPKGTSKGLFTERPDANKFYPDIAVPLEAVGEFSIQKGENQSVWIDIYIPKNAPPGIYRGTIAIQEANKKTLDIPISLEVFPFALPDTPSAKTMLWFSEADVNYRYTGVRWDDSRAATPDKLAVMQTVWNRHHLLAHRHKISLVNDGIDPLNKNHWKMQRWFPVLNGELFTEKNGYDGPGVGVSSGIYSIGTYGGWRNKTRWSPDSEEAMRQNTDMWVLWFEKNFPKVEYFLYLLDEPKTKDFPLVEKWASWVKNNPGPGHRMKTLVTSNMVKQAAHMPSVDISFDAWGPAESGKAVEERYAREDKKYWAYNGWRPATGSFMIEDDGIALRMLGWTQYKHKVSRWFFWASTSYKSGSRSNYETNVFEQAQTFGRKNDQLHPKYGETGSEYANGDGVLFYPGTDTHFPQFSYGLTGPIASLRLKQWRRGIQDTDYLTMAAQKDPKAVAALVQKMIPKTLWEVGVTDPKDPSYVHADISWSINPDDWEQARRQLANIIQGKK